MRLLELKADGTIALTQISLKDERPPKYAVLSHTWLLDGGEVTFDDISNGKAELKPDGYRKIRFCGEQAAKDGLQYFWVDSCCINKASSQELQEAITLMYQWYRKAARCYVYMFDVSTAECSTESGSKTTTADWQSAFRGSRWFTRGWTLQELLAPPSVEFYSVSGIRLGDKDSLRQCIHEVTGIPLRALRGESLSNFTIEERLKWAERRETERKEDRAYCLLGIFEVLILPQYGEGDHAFERLLKEIRKQDTERVKLDHLLDCLPVSRPGTLHPIGHPTRRRTYHSDQTQDRAHNSNFRVVKPGARRMSWIHGRAPTDKSEIARNVAKRYNDREAHRALAEQLVLLMSATLKQNICGLQSPGALVSDIDQRHIESEIPQELQYACLNWVEHCRQGRTQLQDDDNFHHFYQNHFLHWLEVLSLMGQTSEIGPMLRLYESLLVPGHNPKQLPFVKDSRKFTLACQPLIERAPLQVYCSALIFSRPSNQVRSHFWDQMHPWLKHVHILDAIGSKSKDEWNYVNDLSFSPNGKQLASGSIEACVRVWDVTSGSSIAKLEEQTDKISSVAISPDGSMLASGSDDSSVMVWDTGSEECTYLQAGHSSWVNTVKFSPDGYMLASGSMDETIRVSEAATGQEICVLTASGGVNCIDFSPDGTLIASGGVNQTLILWDIKRREPWKELHGHTGPVNSVHFSRGGDRLVSGSDDMTIRLWDVSTGRETNTLRGHVKKVTAVAFSPDASQVASGSADKTVKLWDCTTGRMLTTLEEHTSGINAVTFSPDGQLLASGSYDDEVRLWNAEGRTSWKKLSAFDDDDGFSNGSSHGHADMVICLMFSSNKDLVASGSRDGTIKLWTKEGVECHSLESHTGSIKHLVFSPTDAMIASASEDGTAILWDCHSGQRLHSFESHTQAIDLLHFSQDGSVLASHSANKTIRLWSTVTGEELRALEGRSDLPFDSNFSSTGRRDLNTENRTNVVDEIESCGTVRTTDVGRSARTYTISPGGKFFESDQGLSRPAPVPTEQSLSASQWSVTEDWIKHGAEYALWLPEAYNAVSVAVWENVMVLGHESGAISFLRFAA